MTTFVSAEGCQAAKATGSTRGSIAAPKAVVAELAAASKVSWLRCFQNCYTFVLKNAPCLSEILCKGIRGLQTPIWGVGVQWGSGFLEIQPMPVVGVAANACRQFRKSLL